MFLDQKYEIQNVFSYFFQSNILIISKTCCTLLLIYLDIICLLDTSKFGNLRPGIVAAILRYQAKQARKKAREENKKRELASTSDSDTNVGQLNKKKKIEYYVSSSSASEEESVKNETKTSDGK